MSAPSDRKTMSEIGEVSLRSKLSKSAAEANEMLAKLCEELSPEQFCFEAVLRAYLDLQQRSAQDQGGRHQ